MKKGDLDLEAEKILAFDSVSSVCSVCIYDGTFHNFETTSSYGHAGELMPLIDRALKELGYELDDIDTLVVGLGPGSFTGIRIGLATALGLTLGSDKKLYGVNSLISRSYDVKGDIVIPMMDARRGNVYAASFGQLEIAPFNGAFSDLLNRLGTSQAVFVGEKLDSFKEEAKGHSFVMPGPLAQGIIKAYLDGRVEEELQPIYLRKAEAQRRLEEKRC